MCIFILIIALCNLVDIIFAGDLPHYQIITLFHMFRISRLTIHISRCCLATPTSTPNLCQGGTVVARGEVLPVYLQYQFS